MESLKMSAAVQSVSNGAIAHLPQLHQRTDVERRATPHHTALALQRETRQRLALEKTVKQKTQELTLLRAELAKARGNERKAHDLALHDELTSLPNRRHFMQRLEHALSHHQGSGTLLALMYLDLDNFKQINDAHGHAVGDELLRVVAARLKAAVRSIDTLGRMGGDEFACLLTDIPDKSSLSQFCAKLFDAVAAPMRLGKLTLTITPSIGCAICPAKALKSGTLIGRADTAMYHAKHTHCGHVFYASGMVTRVH
jgi:diguanylate cyclase (GGDEF)-like protein